MIMLGAGIRGVGVAGGVSSKEDGSLLLETGEFILLEAGFNIVLE